MRFKKFVNLVKRPASISGFKPTSHIPNKSFTTSIFGRGYSSNVPSSHTDEQIAEKAKKVLDFSTFNPNDRHDSRAQHLDHLSKAIALAKCEHTLTIWQGIHDANRGIVSSEFKSLLNKAGISALENAKEKILENLRDQLSDQKKLIQERGFLLQDTTEIKFAFEKFIKRFNKFAAEMQEAKNDLDNSVNSFCDRVSNESRDKSSGRGEC
jgi:hypothetical protein